MPATFVHLHTHSHYSLLSALPKVRDLVSAAKACGMPALALTDSGSLYGAIEFYKACRKENIKPILGVDAYVAARSRTDKEPGIDNKRARLILLAQNLQGYKNLLKLVTRSHIEGFYYKPRVDRALLEEYHDGLIAIIPSFSGETTLALKASNKKGAAEILAWYQSVFGNDNVYLEITHHPEIEGHQQLQKLIVELAQNSNTPLVAAHDVYYLHQEDKQARDALVHIQSGTSFGDRGGLNEEKEDFSFIDQTTAERYFKDFPEALKNTVRIAEHCDVELPLGTLAFPNYLPKGGRSLEDELRMLTYDGINRRGLSKTKALEERIDYELGIIQNRGYTPYFLTVADLIRFAHKNNILTTTRGSAAGSMVSYLTGITNVDPIAYNLPFERFLNPDRPSAPDVDMDFADNRRDEVIQYAREKYGDDKVAQIGTFGTMMARAAVRDVARALGHSYNTGDTIAKLIPFGSQGFPMSIDKALSIEPELKKLYSSEPDAKAIIDLAKKIEGNVRHISVHAAGVVISPTALTDFVPLQLDPKGGKVITQFDMHAVEDAGLPKLDFLGIRNLAILADSVHRVRKLRSIDIDIENIPLDDERTFEMLTRGETMGLFQLNGTAMTKFLKDLRPSTIDDINAMVALYRPGPMKNIPEYIARKHGTKAITYYHPKMRTFLDRSYGILVYQDDLIFTALNVAGYTWKTVDTFRKAVGKKIPEEMAKQHTIFVDGCMKHSGMTHEQAEGLWNLFEPFQGYGFNKAHAASYGKVAYQTAYMKANFPVEYMAALLTAEAGDIAKVYEAIVECQRLGIEVLPPDVNESLGDFAVVLRPDKEVESKIRFGLHSVKNFGEGIADAIIAERKANGRYTSLANFLSRIKNRNLNRKSLEALIKCGALDQFDERGVMLHNLDRLVNFNKECVAESEHQDSLFGDVEITAPSLSLESVEPTTTAEKLSWEKELLGLYVSGHPLDRHRDKLKRFSKNIHELKETVSAGMPAVIGGIVEEAKPILTKSGEKMAFVRIADFGESIETVVFPRIFSEYHELLQPEQCIAIRGRMSNRGGEKSIIVEAVKAL
ncbi:MAG TPA: DNA polymerase III subunit alpha [Candidatus Paceibacterota bacterium]